MCGKESRSKEEQAEQVTYKFYKPLATIKVVYLIGIGMPRSIMKGKRIL
jgi:hypothetical protein